MKKDKTRVDFEKWAFDHLAKMQRILLLEDYHPLILETPCKSEGANAECVFFYPYKRITVRYDDELMDMWKEGKLDTCIKTLTHEMCHVVTDALYAKATNTYRTRDEIEDERERLTDHITNIILKNKII